jgi:kynurenine formamidase
MCVPMCQKKMAEIALNRRNFLKAAGGAAAAATASMMAAPVMADEKMFSPMNLRVSKVIDLTHTLSPEFPTYGGTPQFTTQLSETLAKEGYNIRAYNIANEHMGTHMDAPFHFSDKATADEIPVENLVGPLAIVDIIDKASKDPDALVTPDDLKRYERRWGRIPFGAIVAMNSGWDANVTTAKFRNADDKGVMHFPGFGLDAVKWLLEMRNVKGIMVDTLSLDNGPSSKFDVHYTWLPAGRWGMENVANLSKLPARGATVIAGGPKYKGATGGPSRVIALI